MFDFSQMNTMNAPAPTRPLFVGSYPSVTPAGEQGGFFVNTYFLQPDRKSELVGPVPVRSADCKRLG